MFVKYVRLKLCSTNQSICFCLGAEKFFKIVIMGKFPHSESWENFLIGEKAFEKLYRLTTGKKFLTVRENE